VEKNKTDKNVRLTAANTEKVMCATPRAGVIISLSYALSLQVDKPLKSVMHGRPGHASQTSVV